MSKASEALLAELHNAVAKDLLEKIKAGATAQELQAAIKFLKDNGIEADLGNPRMSELAEKVLPPTFDDEYPEDATVN